MLTRTLLFKLVLITALFTFGVGAGILLEKHLNMRSKSMVYKNNLVLMQENLDTKRFVSAIHLGGITTGVMATNYEAYLLLGDAHYQMGYLMLAKSYYDRALFYLDKNPGRDALALSPGQKEKQKQKLSYKLKVVNELIQQRKNEREPPKPLLPVI